MPVLQMTMLGEVKYIAQEGLTALMSPGARTGTGVWRYPHLPWSDVRNSPPRKLHPFTFQVFSLTRPGRPTSLDLLRRRTNLPSSSTSSTATRPLVRACWEKLLRLSVDSSLRFLVTLLPLCVWDEWEEARPRLRCEVGLGDRRSLWRGRQSEGASSRRVAGRQEAAAAPCLPRSPPLLLALQELAVGVDLHVQGQLDVQKLLVLVQLLLHPCPHFCHLPLLVCQQPPAGVAFTGQRVLQVPQLRFLSCQLVEGEWGSGEL